MVAKVVSNPLRQRHRALVLGTLRADGVLSRAEIARRLGVSIPTAAEILSGFEAEGLVEVVGEGESSGGRRPLLYGLRTDGLQAVGVNVDLDRISAVISDLSGETQAETAVQSDLADGHDTFVSALHRVLDDIVSGLEEPRRLAGIGIALPATMRRSNRGIFTPTETPGWADSPDWGAAVDLYEVVGDRYRLPVVIENRARAAVVGEFLFGAGQGWSDFLCLILGTGLGAGIMSGGRLFVGGDGGAGVIGRMRLDVPGYSGNGQLPVVSDLVSVAAIRGKAVDRLERAGRGSLAGVPVERVDADLVIDQALAGDEDMRDVLADVGRVVGVAVAATLCVTDSELVLLCGPTMRAGDLIVDPLKDALASRAPFTTPEVRLGRLGGRAGTLGATALVLTDFVHEVGIPG